MLFSFWLRSNHRRLLQLSTFVLALGLGVGITVFSVADEALLKPIRGVENANDLMTVEFRSDGIGYPISHRALRKLQESLNPLVAVTAVDRTSIDFSTKFRRRPQRLECELIPDNFFAVLGVTAALGSLEAGATFPGVEVPVWISTRLWHQELRSDPEVVGSTVKLNGVEATVVGVLRHPFSGVFVGKQADVWMSVEQIQVAHPYLGDDFLIGGGGTYYQVIARPRFEVTSEWLRARISGARLDLDLPLRPGSAVTVVSWGIGRPVGVRNTFERIVFGLSLLGSLFLLITLLNSSTLLFAVELGRYRDWAVLQALGADRNQIMKKAVREALLSLCIALITGTVFAEGFLRIFKVQFPYGLRVAGISLSGRLLLFVTLLTLVIGLVSAVISTFMALRTPPSQALREAAGPVKCHFWPLKVLLLLELGAMTALCAIAFSLVQTLENYSSLELGFDARNVLVTPLSPVTYGLKNEERRKLYRDLLGHLALQPDIEASAVADSAPFSNRIVTMGVRGHPEGEEPLVPVQRSEVSSDYFAALGVSLKSGRSFRPEEVFGSSDADQVCLVSEGLAERLWGQSSAEGRFLNYWTDSSCRVIGVTSDHRTASLHETDYLVFFPLSRPTSPEDVLLLVKTRLPPAQIEIILEREIQRLAPTLPMYSVESLEGRVREEYGDQAQFAESSWVVSFLAIVLCGLGAYSLVGVIIQARWRELGIRAALGAPPIDNLLKVLAEPSLAVLGGLVLGYVFLILLSARIDPFLFQTKTYDWRTFGLAAGVITGSVLIGGLIVSRVVIGINPAELLRKD